VVGRRKPLRISDAVRHDALTRLDALNAAGFIQGRQELEERRRLVRAALYQNEIDAAFESLPNDVFRQYQSASDADREQAHRQIEMHLSNGNLTLSEAQGKHQRVADCRTVEDIARVIVDLPDLGSAGGARFVSETTRANAHRQLLDHRQAGRLTQAEYDVKAVQVDRARTREDINEAFANLRGQRMGQLATAGQDMAEAVTGVAVEVRSRLARALLRAGAAVVVALVGIYLLVTGEWKLAVASLLFSVVVFGYAAVTFIKIPGRR